jgi:hypothetical protein
MMMATTQGLLWPFVLLLLAQLPTLTTTSTTTNLPFLERQGIDPNEAQKTQSSFYRFERSAPPIVTTAQKICAKGNAICIPSNYSKFDLPNETLTEVNVGIDIKDIPKIDDKEFSITLNAFFVVRWTDQRMIIDQVNKTY